MYKFFVGAILLAGSFIHVNAQTARHVVLVSIDGLRPEFYLDPSWNTPNLRKLMAKGAYAESAKSVFPSVTFPSHTTIVTGALPARHNIYFNAPYGAGPGVWYWEESLIKTPTLWDAVRDAKLTSGAVMWPVTVGAPINYNFPVRRADGDDKSDQLTVTRSYVNPKNLLDEMSKDFTLVKTDFEGKRSDPSYQKMASYIIAKHRPNLMAVHFVSVDHEQHENGRDAEPVRHAISVVDSLIGELVKTVDQQGLSKSTVFIITGDHGMVDNEYNFAPNLLLAENGLLGKAKFTSTGGSAFLYLTDPKDFTTAGKVKAIFENLTPDQKRHFRVFDRKEMDKAGTNRDAVLALGFAKGTVGVGGAEAPLLKSVKKGRGSHGYSPEIPEVKTGFIIAGPGVKAKGKIPELGIKDIAPLISKILNLDFKAPDGVLPPNILK